jgi:conjugal transfer pilus assembly protein TraE
MDYDTKKDNEKKLKDYLLYALILVGILFIINLAQAFGTYWAMYHKAVYMYPQGQSKPFSLRENSMDSEVLVSFGRLMVGLRFDISPGNVEYNISQLEKYMSPESFDALKPELDLEKQYIKDNKMTSNITITDVQPESQYNAVIISGSLSRSENEVPISTKQVKYLIQFSYEWGVIKLINFKDVSHEKKVTL